LNILFVTSNFPPLEGGIAAFDYHICKELSGLGHKVLVLSNRVVGDEIIDSQQNFRVKRLNGRVRPTSGEAIYEMLNLTRKEKIETIFFGHFGSTHWLGGVLAKKIFKIPYVILVHGTEFNAYFHGFTWADNWASKVVLRNASRVVVNSRTTKNLVEEHGYSSNRIHVVHPGANLASFEQYYSHQEVREKSQLKHKKVLLTVSRLVSRKNHENVLKALPLVIERVPDLIYFVVGKGEEEDRLKGLTKNLGLGEYVKFVGYVEPEDVSFYYKTCDVFIMPSKREGKDYEGFGIVYAEANACGKPVIGGKSGGVEDAVIDGVTGLLVDPENIEDISGAIIRLLTDQEYAKRLGENGRRRVEEELNWTMVGRKIEEIMKKTLTDK